MVSCCYEMTSPYASGGMFPLNLAIFTHLVLSSILSQKEREGGGYSRGVVGWTVKGNRCGGVTGRWCTTRNKERETGGVIAALQLHLGTPGA